MLSGSEQFEKDANQFIEDFIRNTESAMSDEAFKNRLTQELLVNMKELISKVEPGVDKRFHIKTVQVDQLLEYGGEVLLHDLSGMGFKIGKSSARQKKSTVLPKRFIDPKGGINYKTVQDLIIADLENKNMHDYENQEMVINNMRVIEKPAVKRYTQLTSTAAVVSPNYGVKFKSGQEALADANAPTNEINIFYMGTGGTIHVGGKHKDVYEGGDVLCHLGLHKGIEQKQPTLLIRGIGTNDDFKTATAYYAKEAKDANTSGYVSETVLAYGLNQRLTVTMEQFFIPTLLQIISKKSSNDELPCDLTFNVTGHSRGAITSYAMVDLIDAWMNEVENMNDKDIDLMVKQIAMEFSDATKSKTFDGKPLTEKALNAEQIAHALKALRDKKVNFKTKLMIFDPVEGDLACGDTTRTSKITTSIFGKKLVCNYGNIPKSVKDALIFLGFDERRVTFQPTVSLAEDPKLTNVSIQPVIGVHGTLKGYFSKFADEGQDSYIAQQGSVFLNEALRASVDLVKIKSCKFIFDTLPAFETVTLCNIFYSNNGQGYVSTKNHLLNSILKHLNEQQSNNYTLADLQNNLSEMLSAEDLIALCKKVMAEDQTLSKQLYFDLEKDVYEIYLSPKNEEHANELRELREEMRKDSMAVLPMGNQASDESRYIWMRNKHSSRADRNPTHFLNKKFASLAYDLFSDIWSPTSIRIGRSLADGFCDPFYFNLLDSFNKDEIDKMSQEEFEAITKLSYEFAELNEKGALYAENNQNKSAELNYSELLEIFSKNIIAAKMNDNLKVKIFAILKMKEEYQYQINTSQIGSCIDIVKDPELKERCLSAQANYQISTALRLTDNECLKVLPKLYFEINALLTNLETKLPKLDDVTFGEYQKLKKVNNISGKVIISNHLKAKLNFWEEELKSCKTVIIQDLESRIKSERRDIKESELLLQTNIDIKTNKPLTLQQIDVIKTLKEIASDNIKKYESRIKSSTVQMKSLDSKLKEIAQQLEKASDFNDLVNIEKSINQLINEWTKTETLINDIAYELKKSNSKYEEIENKKMADLLFKNGYKDSLARYERIAELTGKINQKHPIVLQSLLTAVKEGNVKAFVEYIQACKNTGIRGVSFKDSISQPQDSEGNSALHLIAKSGNMGLWHAVVNSGYVAHGIGLTKAFTYTPDTIFDFTAKNKEGLTPIAIAAKEGNVHLVEEMMHFYNKTPKEQLDRLLNRAKKKSDKSSVKPILSLRRLRIVEDTNLLTLVDDADLLKGINEKNKSAFESFLTIVREGDPAKLTKYIDVCKKSSTKFSESIDSARDSHGNSALHLIAKSGNSKLWEMVANSGYKQDYAVRWTYPYHIFDFNLQNDYGLTPLDVAVKAGNVEIVEGMKKIYQSLDPKKYSDQHYQELIAKAEQNKNKNMNKKAYK